MKKLKYIFAILPIILVFLIWITNLSGFLLMVFMYPLLLIFKLDFPVLMNLYIVFGFTLIYSVVGFLLGLLIEKIFKK